jgi:predicted RecB family nuclease
MTTERLLTPTQITAWLGCAHTMTLTAEVAAGRMAKPVPAYGALTTLLMEKGVAHERAHLDALRSAGRDVLEIPGREPDESFARWAERCRPLLAKGHDVLFQMPLVHDGMRGVADFLERVEAPSDLGAFSYEPVDAKLARREAKPGHLLQLCFYADAIAELQGVRPRTVHLQLGSGQRESVVLATIDAYWRRVRGQLVVALDEPAPTVARKCAQCDQCEFFAVCDKAWRDRDALHDIATIRASEVDRCEAAGVMTRRSLATGTGPIAELKDQRVDRLRRQATLQLARPEGGVPAFEVIDRTAMEPEIDVAARLPADDDGDVFLDFEGHPFWRADTGLFFLFGALVRDAAAPDGWAFRAWWAHDLDSEGRATSELIDWIAQRRTEHPAMHVYHYNHTERSSLTSLADRHGARTETLEQLVAQGVFVDLLEVVRHTVIVGAESYSLKQVERAAGYERGHDIDAGAGAVVSYERWMRDRDDDHLHAIARYNEDDVRATLAVRDWLRREVLQGVPDRSMIDFEPLDPREVDDLIAALLEREEEWLQLLGHLLDYWSREFRTARTQALAQLEGDDRDLADRPDVITDLRFEGIEPPVKPRRTPTARYSFPPQSIGFDVEDEDQTVIFRTPDGMSVERSIVELDRDGGTLQLRVSTPRADDDAAPMSHPAAFVRFSSYWAGAKRDELVAFAQRMLDGDALSHDAARIQLLRHELPRFHGRPGVGAEGLPSDAALLAPLAVALDHSVLAVQGPPGTGKTHTGAALIAALVAAGKRVGVTAFSKAAIDNLLRKVAADHPEIRILSKNDRPDDEALLIPGVEYGAAAKQWDPDRYDVFGGTTWLFASPVLVEQVAFDVLVIDEAGQMGLADALAAMSSARSVILLGDPLQLAQVSVAEHPGTSGASSLEHVLDGAATMPPERGVFLGTTRRMHPTITRFLSEQIYDSRLTAHPDCALRTLDDEAGIRWLKVEHTGCTVESEVEAEAVRDLIESLVGRTLVDADGTSRPLEAQDVMVVAPFNRQVRRLRRTLNASTRTAGTRVGTVDKFQGQEKPVVIFSMTSSSGEDLTRGIDFLFSRNRLNVAVSRAQTLAYVVCTDALLDTRAKDVGTMQLIGTLCALVEAAEPSGDD